MTLGLPVALPDWYTGPVFKRKKKTTAPDTALAKPEPRVVLSTPATASYGGWLPRTALHLHELYAYLAHGTSTLPLHAAKLAELHQSLALTAVARETGYLEYIRADTELGIEIRFYEDGLYVLSLETDDPGEAASVLQTFHDTIFKPAVAYLFSMGAPLPELPVQQVKPDLLLAVTWPNPSRFAIDGYFGKVSSSITSDEVSVYRTERYVFVVCTSHRSTMIRDLVEMQIFFSQFSDQLHQYLSLHRSVWAEVAVIAERRVLQPAQLNKARTVLFQLAKTADLASGRLAQMSSYLQTRASLAEELQLGQQLGQLFHYRFEVLQNSHDYVQQNWRMTSEYIERTVGMLDSLRLSTLASWLASLMIISLVAAISSVLGWLRAGQGLSIEHAGFMAVVGIVGTAVVIGLLIWQLSIHGEFRLRHPSLLNSGQTRGKAKKSKK